MWDDVEPLGLASHHRDCQEVLWVHHGLAVILAPLSQVQASKGLRICFPLPGVSTRASRSSFRKGRVDRTRIGETRCASSTAYSVSARRLRAKVLLADVTYPGSAGSAYTVGPMNRDHWLLYLTSPNSQPLLPSDVNPSNPLALPPTTPISTTYQDHTLEILMSHPPPPPVNLSSMPPLPVQPQATISGVPSPLLSVSMPSFPVKRRR